MGYMRHHAIVVTSYDDYIKSAHTKALKIFGPTQVTDLIAASVNGYKSFLIGPDGSKEGWEPSATGDYNREKFVTWMNSKAHEDGSSSLKWVEVQYGDDDSITSVVNSSDDHFIAQVDKR